VKKSIGNSVEAGDALKPASAALGFRAHSGWAAMVALAMPMRSPKVVGRSRLELANPEIPRPVQPYHAAQKMELQEAETYIAAFAAEARNLATKAMRSAIHALKEEGFQVVGCGIVTGSGRPAPTVKAALASHPLLHTAEGELFRSAIIHASQRCHLSVLEVRERELFQRSVIELGLSLDALQFSLTNIGKSFGPPWGQDQKLATLVAWLALDRVGAKTR
jgi:hypothetical protein